MSLKFRAMKIMNELGEKRIKALPWMDGWMDGLWMDG